MDRSGRTLSGQTGAAVAAAAAAAAAAATAVAAARSRTGFRRSAQCNHRIARTRAVALMRAGEAFYVSVAHAKPLAVGLNCALGAVQMKPFMQRLSAVVDCFAFCYPNAGLPNSMGGYDDTPETMAGQLKARAHAHGHGTASPASRWGARARALSLTPARASRTLRRTG